MERYLFDESRFAANDLDGETMLMDLKEGRLVLLEFGTAQLWPWLRTGVPLSVLEEHIDARKGQAAAEDFIGVVNRLVILGALVPTKDDFSLELPAPGELPDEMGQFLMTEYEDISTIITMDPIHDVDPERGWPFDDIPSDR